MSMLHLYDDSDAQEQQDYQAWEDVVTACDALNVAEYCEACWLHEIGEQPRPCAEHGGES